MIDFCYASTGGGADLSARKLTPKAWSVWLGGVSTLIRNLRPLWEPPTVGALAAQHTRERCPLTLPRGSPEPLQGAPPQAGTPPLPALDPPPPTAGNRAPEKYGSSEVEYFSLRSSPHSTLVVPRDYSLLTTLLSNASAYGGLPAHNRVVFESISCWREHA